MRIVVQMKAGMWVFSVALFMLVLAGAAHADLVRAIASVKPSVVLVGTFKSANSPRFELRGTGFVVGKGNWVVTNAHVVPQTAGGMSMMVPVWWSRSRWLAIGRCVLLRCLKWISPMI